MGRGRAAKNALLLLMDNAVAPAHAPRKNTIGWRAPRPLCPDHSQIKLNKKSCYCESYHDVLSKAGGRLIHPCEELCCSVKAKELENEKDCIDWCVVVDCCKSGDRNYVCGYLPGAKRRKDLRFSVFKVAEWRMLLRRQVHG